METAPGLSTAHIATPPREAGWGRVTYWRGGSLVSVAFEGLCEGDPGGSGGGGGLRGTVRGFSLASRRRLMRKVAMINRVASRRLPAFITLTYPGSWPSDPEVWKDHLEAFFRRLERRVGRHAIIWRLEFQRRGAPHFHLIGWDLRVTHALRAWVSRAWYEVVGSGDERHLRAGTNVERVKSWHSLTAYLSKYMAKVEAYDGPSPLPTGRIWGIRREAMLPIEPVQFLVEFREALAMKRVMRRHSGIRPRNPRRMAGLSVFMPARMASKLLEWASGCPTPTEIGGLPPPLLWASLAGRLPAT